MSGPFCGADGRQCFRDTTKDKTCLLAGRCMGVEQAAVSPSAAIGIVGPDGRGVANGANATQRAEGVRIGDRHAACPDPDHRCQHGDDLNCPALVNDETRANDLRYRYLKDHWDKFTGLTWREPSRRLDEVIDAEMRSDGPEGK